MTTRPTEQELWAAQLTQYPDSVRLSPVDVIRWAEAPTDPIRQLRRYRAICMALQDPVHVWYRTKPEGGFMGCRFGQEPSEYLSNFDDL